MSIRCAARSRACRRCCAAAEVGRRRCHIPLQPRARSHRARATAGVSARLLQQSIAHLGARALRAAHAHVWRAVARPRYRTPRRRDDARACAMRASRSASIATITPTGRIFVARRGPAWTRRQMLLAVERFREVFGTEPTVHGAAGWQMNETALALEQELGFLYASDTRGAAPFVPLLAGRRSRCPQLPTTLPTLDELIGVDGIGVDRVHEPLLARTREPLPAPRIHAARRARRDETAAGAAAVARGLARPGLPAGVHAHAAREPRCIGVCPAASCSRARCPGASGLLAVQAAAQPV